MPKKKSRYRLFFKFLDMFCTHKHSNCAITPPLFNYMFQNLSLLHWQVSKCEWHIFLLFSVFLFLFTDILISRVHVRIWLILGMWILLMFAGHSESRDLTLGCMIWNIYGKELLLSVWWACLWHIWIESGFTLALFQVWGVGSKALLEQVQL